MRAGEGRAFPDLLSVGGQVPWDEVAVPDETPVLSGGSHLEVTPGHTWREHSWSPCDHTDPSTGPTSRLGFWPDPPRSGPGLLPSPARAPADAVPPPPALGPVPSPELLALLRQGVTRLHSARTRVGGREGMGGVGAPNRGRNPPSRLPDSWPATPPGALGSRRLQGAGPLSAVTARTPRWPVRVPPRRPPLGVPPRVLSAPTSGVPG